MVHSERYGGGGMCETEVPREDVRQADRDPNRSPGPSAPIGTMPLTEVVALNVRVERVRRRWNQGELGERIGLSRTGVSELESGKRRTGLDDLVPLCNAFSIDLSRLLDGADRADRESLGLWSYPAKTCPAVW
jgi:DNA-binding Xre family transcriptional regulator